MNFLDSTVQPIESPNESDAMNQTEHGSESAPFLIFRVGETLWAVPALAVSEIHALPLLSPLPETAPFILGMFNLRGVIVPVMDLNARFTSPSSPLQLDNRLIVLNWGSAPVAILADEVRAVTRISSEAIDSPPTHGRQQGLATPFVAGVTQIDEEIVLLLHLPHLLDFKLDTMANGESSPNLNFFAPTFDSTLWSESERQILQERAFRLRQLTISDSENEGLEPENSENKNRAPVAVFVLGGEEFAASLDVVREFASVTNVASVPCCPPHILGQINLRGDIVTLLDVRQTLRTARTTPPFFAPPKSDEPANPVSVVVVEHDGNSIGIAVDEVKDVLYLRPEEWSSLNPGADRERTVNSEQNQLERSEFKRSFFARGAVYQGRFLPMLDLQRLLSGGGLEVNQTV